MPARRWSAVVEAVTKRGDDVIGGALGDAPTLACAEIEGVRDAVDPARDAPRERCGRQPRESPTHFVQLLGYHPKCGGVPVPMRRAVPGSPDQLVELGEQFRRTFEACPNPIDESHQTVR